MNSYEELEVKIKFEKTKLATLEEMYENEPNENKQTKLEYRISRQDESLNRLIERQDALLDKENKKEAKDEDKEVEDDTVCPICGSDLYEDGDFLYCEKCEEYYERVEE